MKKSSIFIVLLLLVFSVSIVAVPLTLTHQGRILDSVGDPITGPQELTFRLFDVSTGGTILWEELHIVDLVDGLFSTTLGETIPLDFSSIDIRPDSLWLEVQVNVDPPLSPRAQLTAMPLSAISTRLKGDLITNPGELFILHPNGDTTAYFGVAADSSRSKCFTSTFTTVPLLRALSSMGTDSSTVESHVSAGLYNQNGSKIEALLKADQGGSVVNASLFDEMSGNGIIYQMNANDQGGGVINGELFTGMVRNFGADTTKVASIGGTSAGGYIALADSLGDTTIFLQGNNNNNGTSGAQIVITKIEPAGIALIGNDSSGVIRSWSNNEALGNGVLVNLIAGLPPGEPVVRYVPMPPGKLSMDNIKNGGLDTTRVVEVGSDSAGGFIMLADSLGDTSVFINGALKKGDKVSLVGFGTFSKTNLRDDGMVVIDTVGDTTVLINGLDNGYRFIRVRVHFQVDAVDNRDDTYISPGEIELNNSADLSGTGSFDPNGGTRIHHAGLEVKSGPADTVITLDSAGNIYASSTMRIGTTLDESVALNVNGDICYTGTIGACSDGRYKKDVNEISGALESLLNLRGVSYAWKQDDFPDREFDNREHLGFIAQEVEELYPEVVTTDSRGFKSVDYGRLTPVLVEAMKEQQKMIDSQKGQIEKQQEQIDKLTKLIYKLTSVLNGDESTQLVHK